MSYIDDYGYITLDKDTDSSSNSNSGSSNNHHNNHNSGKGRGFAYVLLIIFIIVSIRIIVHAVQNRNSGSSTNQPVEITDTEQIDNNQDSSYEESENDSDGYILPNSDSEYIFYDDLTDLSQWEVSLARNEIYARRGRKFTTDSIREYFESKSWYHPYIDPEDFSDSIFNNYEKENIDTIVNYEKEHGWR